MVAALVLGGLGAVCWGVAALLTAPSSRILGASRSVLYVGVGAVPFGVLLASLGGPLRIRTAELPALLGAGMFLLVATQLWSLLAGRGQLSLAAPIVACDGAVAAVASVLAGQRLPAAAYLGLSCMVTGLVVLSGGRGSAGPPRPGRLSRPATIAIAAAAAGGYGGMLFCAGTVDGTSAVWTVVLARALATVGALGLCLRQGRVRPVWSGTRFALAAGIADLCAFTLFVAGARHDLAIAAVAVSQYGAVAALAAVVLFGERLSRRQGVGVAVLVLGAGVVAAAGA